MMTLVIHTPKPTDQSGNRSFEDTIATCVGEEFAISRNMYSELKIGMPLIILDKRQRKQAEAIISGFEPGTFAANGIRRYNIFFQDPRLVAYTGDEIKLTRCGVAVRPFSA
jgi:hypothetical protein